MEELIIDGKKVLGVYLKWLRDNMSFKQLQKNVAAIDSPFLDAHNDYIRLYIKKTSSDEYMLTDDGSTFYDLKSSGLNLTKTRKKAFNTFVRSHGVDFNSNTSELFTYSDWRTLPQKKNDLLLAIINIGDMFLLTERYTKSVFFEDVSEFFREKKIPAIPDVYIAGKGFIKDRVDFIIPKIDMGTEKIVKLINSPSKGFYQRFMFIFLDIKQGTSEHKIAKQIFFINDEKKKVNDLDLQAIKAYSIEPILWSEREDKAKTFVL